MKVIIIIFLVLVCWWLFDERSHYKTMYEKSLIVKPEEIVEIPDEKSLAIEYEELIPHPFKSVH